ncbi:MAG: S4 domain-containing protein [Candidatus Eisenbacteria bacterium]
MRLDIFLKRTGLIKQRSLAKEICDRGSVGVDGRKAKAGKEIDCGRIITLDLRDEFLEIEVLSLPGRNCKRKDGEECYRIIDREHRDPLC